MTYEEFATETTKQADYLVQELDLIHPAMASAACLEACCKIAMQAGQNELVAKKMSQVALLLYKGESPADVAKALQ